MFIPNFLTIPVRSSRYSPRSARFPAERRSPVGIPGHDGEHPVCRLDHRASSVPDGSNQHQHAHDQGGNTNAPAKKAMIFPPSIYASSLVSSNLLPDKFLLPGHIQFKDFSSSRYLCAFLDQLLGVRVLMYARLSFEEQQIPPAPASAF